MDDVLQRIEHRQVEHEKLDVYRFGDISKTLTDIKENHLAHMQIAQERQAVEMTWLKWLLMGICGGIGALTIALLVK